MKNSNTFYERLIELVNNTGKSMNCIEYELNYPRNALSNYKNSAMPSAIRLLEISSYFGVTPNYMMGFDIDEVTERSLDFFTKLSFEEKVAIYESAVEWMKKEVNAHVKEAR